MRGADVVVVGPCHLLIRVIVFLGVDLIDSKLGISANFSKGVFAHSCIEEILVDGVCLVETVVGDAVLDPLSSSLFCHAFGTGL